MTETATATAPASALAQVADVLSLAQVAERISAGTGESFTVYRKGEPIEFISPLTDDEVADLLLLVGSDFAGSLFSARRRWSVRQRAWAHRIALERLERERAPEADGPVAPVPFEAVAALLHKAGESLKRPRVIIMVDQFQGLKLSLAGNRSKVPGSVNVITFAGDTWLGRVTPSGEWHGKPLTGWALELLQRFAADPAGVAAASGKLAGSCSFCHRPLDDERSTEVGYGPVCAKRYGLPWGKAKTAN